MNENIDLTQILKNCPKGWKFYSSIHGELLFSWMYVSSSASHITFIKPDSISMVDGTPITVDYYLDGRYYPNQGECTIFPSKEQRDWSEFTAPWYKKELEHEFHEGDWVVYNNDICQIVKREEGHNKLVTVFGIEKELVNERNLSTARLWTIQDAKDGDVLCCESGWMCIFKSLNNNTNTFSSYCFMDRDKYFFNSGNECHTLDTAYNGFIYPATKEQCDLFFQKIREAGYKWNIKTKTLEKLVKHKFDPKTLKPFDKVLVRDTIFGYWECEFFSHYMDDIYPYVGITSSYKYCIPYNDETKYLVGTDDEAPEYYKYWED